MDAAMEVDMEVDMKVDVEAGMKVEMDDMVVVMCESVSLMMRRRTPAMGSLSPEGDQETRGLCQRLQRCGTMERGRAEAGVVGQEAAMVNMSEGMEQSHSVPEVAEATRPPCRQSPE